MKKIPLILICLCFLSSALWASPYVCVRNDLKTGMGFCENGMKDWAFFYPADENEKFEVCAKKYAKSMCDQAPGSFVWAETKAGDLACVQNNNVENFNFCESRPVQFSYILTEAPQN